jgi:hypothetical protein
MVLCSFYFSFSFIHSHSTGKKTAFGRGRFGIRKDLHKDNRKHDRKRITDYR